jgi:hypothetical protein
MIILKAENISKQYCLASARLAPTSIDGGQLHGKEDPKKDTGIC